MPRDDTAIESSTTTTTTTTVSESDPDSDGAKDDTISEPIAAAPAAAADDDGQQQQTSGRAPAPTSNDNDAGQLQPQAGLGRAKDATRSSVASKKKNPDSSHKHNRWRKQHWREVAAAAAKEQQDDHLEEEEKKEEEDEEDRKSSPTFSDDETALAAEGAHKESAKSKQQIDKTAVRQRQVKPSKAAAAAAKGSQVKARVASSPEPSTSSTSTNSNNNKYTIVKEKNIDDSSVHSLLASKQSSGADAATGVDDEVVGGGEQDEQPAMSSSSGGGGDHSSDAMQPQLSQVVLPFKRPEDEQRNKYIPQQPLQEELQQKQRPSSADAADEEQLSFEAIASAISTTLSANAQQQLLATDKPLEGPLDNSANGHKDSIMESADLTEVDSASSIGDAAEDGARGHSRRGRLSLVASSMDQNQQQPIRRRLTPGEHVAEVIDHIVERRKQSSGPNSDMSGPQIVVVAPVGGSQMMARSLTKAEQPVASTTAAQDKQKNVKQTEAKAAPAAAKKEAAKEASKNGEVKKSALPSKSRQTKPLGARLLGVSSAAGRGDATTAASAMKFSERVEVIEDDDSSALLFKEPQMQDQYPASASTSKFVISPGQIDDRLDAGDEQVELEGGESHMTLEQLLLDQPETSHVSSQAGEARLRSPRHNESPGLAFERYAPLQTSSITNRKPVQDSQARIYSAEKLIAEHLLKSKVQSAAAAAIAQISNNQNADDIKRSSGGSGLELITGRGPQAAQQQQPLKQVKVAPTTIKPHIAATSGPTTGSSSQQQQDSRQQPLSVAASEQIHNRAIDLTHQATNSASYRSDGQRQLNNNYHQQPAAAVAAQSQLMEPLQQQQPHQQHNQQSMSQPQQPQQPQQVEQGQQQHPQTGSGPAQQSLPVFADQEYNVPAHMAESVIHKIQMSPLSVSMVNGQATLVGGMNHQVPHHHPLYHPQQQQQFLPNLSPSQYPQQHMMLPPQSYGQAMAAASEPHPMFQQQQVAPSQQQQQQAAAWQRIAAANNKLQQQQHKRSFFQRQGRSDTPTESWMTSKTISLNPAKAMANPLAQMAFKHLLGSLVGKSGSISLPRPENLANIPIKLSFPSPLPQNPQPALRPEVMNVQSQKMARAVGPQPMQQQQQQQQPMNPIMMNHPQSTSIVVPPTSGQQALQPNPNLQTAAMVGVNSAASSNVGATATAAASDATSMAQRETVDQDMEESYGQMPTYHMAPQGYGGGEGRNYPYEGDHDKKSKGITFHFGGGPIGGGTQLITSPMGIFKHLMIPLLPNPRVNLNGKVVFGVVLEKSTAIGEPKKKYKFWGR